VAYAGVLAGPGASWGDVREAMRDKAVLDVVGTTVSALQQTLGNELIACTQPPLGRPTGYPLINLTPNDAGIEVDAYLAESAGEYLGQAMALLKRDFRQGPHERLGTPQQVRLASTNGEPFGLLIDGEQVECGAEELFELVTCEVDLLAAA
jgi:hypothetical protein